jgi:hypothetical protein
MAEIDPRAQSYYDRIDLETALQIAQEQIEEWDYEADPHGYCHERPVLMLLVRAAGEEDAG